jgi:protein AATF/BFR2
MARDPFNVDEADDFDDGTRAVAHASDSASGADSGDENARLTSSRRRRLAAGRSKGVAAERASALRVQNWDAGAPEGRVVKRSELGMAPAEDEEDSPDEDAMADWSDAEPFGASDQEEEEEQEQTGDDESEDGGDEEEEEDAEHLIRGFEKEDATQLMSARDREKVAEKARYVRHQKLVWERCLEVQIYTKRLLTGAKTAAGAEDLQDDEAQRQAVVRLYECIDTVAGLQAKLCNTPELTPPPSASAKKRKRSCDELWVDLSSENVAALPQYNDILNAYSRKMDLAAGAKSGGQAKKFRAVNQDILAQVEAVLVDPQRVKRKAHAPVDRADAGGHTSNEDDAAEDALDELMYDDSDFYQQLLKEFIESGGGAQDAPLQRAHRKKRKAVNRKASKGRQLRFNVHPKLENFMFPEPYPKPEMDVDELFRSLFGQRR